jgi:quinol monooxygenase YgiN
MKGGLAPSGCLPGRIMQTPSPLPRSAVNTHRHTGRLHFAVHIPAKISYLERDDFHLEALMVHVLVRHKVADYNRWKLAFDSHLNTRRRAGETAFRVFHAVDNPREVVLFFDWESIEQARKFMGSDELRKAMQQAGVEGSPDVQYIEDVLTVHRSSAD